MQQKPGFQPPNIDVTGINNERWQLRKNDAVFCTNTESWLH
jgi:hypothetical protein